MGRQKGNTSHNKVEFSSRLSGLKMF